jgi:hypothetical protein
MLDRDMVNCRSYLESLSTRELVTLAGEAGIDIPPDLDRIFIIRELLDDAFEDGGGGSPPLAEKSGMETAPLPRQYHINYLEVLPRDPQWAFVFWEIKAQDRERCEGSPRFEGYALRALEIRAAGEAEAFSVPVGVEDHSWYLGFPANPGFPHSGSAGPGPGSSQMNPGPPGGRFRVVLWVRGLDTVLIRSRPFSLPRFLNSPGNEEILARPMIRLSGAADFAVLRDTNRVTRRFI